MTSQTHRAPLFKHGGRLFKFNCLQITSL